MSLTILFKWKGSGLKSHSIGKTRSEQETNLRKEWGKTITDEQLDKMKFLEKKAKEKIGLDKNFLRAIDADKVK